MYNYKVYASWKNGKGRDYYFKDIHTARTFRINALKSYYNKRVGNVIENKKNESSWYSDWWDSRFEGF